MFIFSVVASFLHNIAERGVNYPAFLESFFVCCLRGVWSFKRRPVGSVNKKSRTLRKSFIIITKPDFRRHFKNKIFKFKTSLSNAANNISGQTSLDSLPTH